MLLLLPLRDAQGALPAAWCVRCRGEVYEPGAPLCPACREEERKKEDRQGQ